MMKFFFVNFVRESVLTGFYCNNDKKRLILYNKFCTTVKNSRNNFYCPYHLVVDQR